MTTLSPIDSKGNIALVKRLANAVYPNSPVMSAMTVTQAILEGGLAHSPPSKLALTYNNLFGIKGIGTKGYVILTTNEFINGQMEQVKQQFASNNDVEDSVLQHKKVLDLPRYEEVAESNTFEDAAEAIYEAGYATDPNYPSKLIETYNIYVKS